MPLAPFVFRHDGVIIALRDAAPAEPGDTTAEEVNRYALRPLDAAEYALFTLDLCNNRIDKHFSRFPEEELEKINGLVPGRPLMERHDLRGSLPRGTFFRSRLHCEGEVVSVRPDVYVLRTPENAGFILNIEGGVYRETSIGFSFLFPECSICGKDLRTCDHIPGQEYQGVLCHFIMRDVVDVLEGSVVPAGSQGTAFVSAGRALPLAAALEGARREFHRPIEVVGPAVLPGGVSAALREQADSGGVALDALPSLVEDGLSARRRAVARCCGLGRELDGDAFDGAAWRAVLEGLALPEIEAHVAGFERRFNVKYPPEPVSKPEALAEETLPGNAWDILRSEA